MQLGDLSMAKIFLTYHKEIINNTVFSVREVRRQKLKYLNSVTVLILRNFY